MDLKNIGELAQKVDKLEKNYARADYILSEIMSWLTLNKDNLNGYSDSVEWATRSYTKYLEDKERG